MPTPNHPERVIYPQNICAYGSNFTQLSGLAWFVYCGFIDAPGITVKYIESQIGTNGSGTQVAEFAILSTPCPPNGNAQILSVLTASAVVSSLTNGTVPFIARTSVLTYQMPAGTHVWTGSRFALSGTQPAPAEGTSKTTLTDFLSLDTATPLTSLTTIQGVIPSMASVNHGVPYLWLTED
jgi:hypothetical protein